MAWARAWGGARAASPRDAPGAFRASPSSRRRRATRPDQVRADDRWRQVEPGYDDINAFLRSVDFSAFNLQEKRPQLIRRIKELQPEASNKAIAEAIGVSDMTVGRDLSTATTVAPERPSTADSEATPDEVATTVAPEPDEADEVEGEDVDDDEGEAEPDDEGDDEEVELPAFLGGEGWTRFRPARNSPSSMRNLAVIAPSSTLEALRTCDRV